MSDNLFIKQISTSEHSLPEERGDNMGNTENNDYAAAIEKKLKDVFMYTSRQVGDETRFNVMMPSEQLQALRVKMIVDEVGDTKLRCYLAKEVDERNVPDVKEKINQLNNSYRFVCLSLDDDRDLCSSYDFILFGDEEAAVNQAFTSLVLFSEITDKCVPDLLPLIWKKDTDSDKPVNVKTNLFQSEGGVA